MKHKKSNKKIERNLQKVIKNEMKRTEMNTIEMSSGDTPEDQQINPTATTQLTDEIKIDLKLQRKKLNAHKNAYKRMVPKTKYIS